MYICVELNEVLNTCVKVYYFHISVCMCMSSVGILSEMLSTVTHLSICFTEKAVAATTVVLNTRIKRENDEKKN